MLIMILFNNPNLIKINYLPDDSINSLTCDINYDVTDNDVMINGEKISINQFWKRLYSNRLVF